MELLAVTGLIVITHWVVILYSDGLLNNNYIELTV